MISFNLFIIFDRAIKIEHHHSVRMLFTFTISIQPSWLILLQMIYMHCWDTQGKNFLNPLPPGKTPAGILESKYFRLPVVSVAVASGVFQRQCEMWLASNSPDFLRSALLFTWHLIKPWDSSWKQMLFCWCKLEVMASMRSMSFEYVLLVKNHV